MKKATQRCLITGASGEIGRAIAVRLAESECTHVLTGRDESALQETADRVRGNGGRAEIIVADLAETAGIERILSHIGSDPLHVLINNAGVAFVGPIENLTRHQWDKTLAVNVTAPFLLIQKLLSRMSSGATIVNILSVAATTVFPEWSSYCMSKYALDGFSRALREELRPRGIRVINVYPAATDTGMWDSIPGDWNRDAMLAPEEVAQAVAYALARPSSVSVDSIHLGNNAGNQ
jgi:NAD(P)-dependent dehydrogenase (short-subunit alcohol dehydrogenase family)